MQNKGYPAEWLYQLKQRNNIVSIISKYVRLEKKGNKYWACCPFHNEKTPSFAVSEDEGFYYCFGCKESGDVISFIMKYESCDFAEAVEILAKNAGMEVPEFVGDKEIIEKKKLKERILKLLDAAYKHYQENLYLPVAKPAQDYIKKRNFTRHELEDFKMGYAVDWNEMINYLRNKGFTYKEMVEAGVARHNDRKREEYIKTNDQPQDSKNIELQENAAKESLIDKNDKTNVSIEEEPKEVSGDYYDVMGKRLVFPIFNSLNECIGFSARVLGDSDYAKYKNTAETLVFQKGRVVFGINLVKALKQKGGLDKIIIVEGQIDVIAMHRAGFKSTVACMGTALTKENAHELKKLSNNVVLCFDGDTAGVKATLRSIDILKDEGFNVTIVSLPDKHDPDEVLKEYGKDYLSNLINNALPITDYLLQYEQKNYDLSKPDEKGKFTVAALGHIAKLRSNSEEEPYLDKVRDLTNIPIDVLRRDLQKIKGGQASKSDKNITDNVLISRENGNIKAIKFILSSLIYKKDFVDKNIDYKKLLPRYVDIIEKTYENIPISSYFDYFDVDQTPILKDCIGMNFEEYKGMGKRYFDECLWSLAKQELENKKAELAKKADESRDLSEKAKIMQEVVNVNKSLKERKMEDFYVRQ